MNASTARAVSSPAAPAAGTAPRHGDVIVARDPDPTVGFSVRLHPGAVQFTTTAREDALRIARGFAAHQRVDLWFNEAGIHPLERYRPPGSEAAGS